MSEEDETSCLELNALEQTDESQQNNGNKRNTIAASNEGKVGASIRKWPWGKLRTGSVLDGGKNPLYKCWQCLEIALLSAVVVVVLLLMLLPTIFYHLPQPVR